LLSTYFSSCGQTSSHQDDVHYYATLATSLNNISPEVNLFWKNISIGLRVAKENEGQKLDEKSLDSLKQSLTQITSHIEDQIKIISTLPETDQEIALKDTLISYMSKTRNLQQQALPIVFELLENGLDKITDGQKKALLDFKEDGRKMLSKTEEIQMQTLEYKNKHQISDEELAKYGL